jgi:uncharacterized membrane protein
MRKRFEPSQSEIRPGVERLEAFSDGVFSIIITLLVLDLRVPHRDALARRGLSDALLAQWPNYAAFIVSFLLVGVVWSNHRAMFQYIRRLDHGLVVLNTLLLLCVAVLPFTAALLAEYVRGTPEEQRLAALVYSGTLVVGGVAFNSVWWHALRTQLTESAEATAQLRALGRFWLLGPVLYAVAFAVAFVSVPLSLTLYALLILYFGISGTWLTRRLAAWWRRGPPQGPSRNATPD